MSRYDLHTTTESMYGKRSRKTQNAVDMARLVRTLQSTLEDVGMLESYDVDDINNVYYALVTTLPKEAQEELRHG